MYFFTVFLVGNDYVNHILLTSTYVTITPLIVIKIKRTNLFSISFQ